jgi:outer membrane protein OmpA-like peptidoglycan-associated protein
MKGASGSIVLSIGCAVSLAVAPVALAQSSAPPMQSGTTPSQQSGAAPTRSEITNALRPIPPAMQGGEQGLPTPGTRPLAQPPKPVFTTSTSGAPVQPASRAHSSATDTAVLSGCTPAGDMGAKPSITLPTITFEFGSAQLKPEAIATLQKLGKSLKKDFPVDNPFLIQGHTDAAGTFDYNQELSKERAQAVRDYLTQEMGIKTQLDVAGVGYCQLANPADPKGAENRRVVVINKAT